MYAYCIAAEPNHPRALLYMIGSYAVDAAVAAYLGDAEMTLTWWRWLLFTALSRPAAYAENAAN